ncbi:glycoprotein IX (platelet) [Megalops cyprinoides]|uniref:glycoprotein IX (platelet) n=1 Tax=Megalops cyprinoides TaxID=118141 RepID=UPI001863E6A7|nr:glycoprotein IX (platelet) [Megalops cyprinoides]
MLSGPALVLLFLLSPSSVQLAPHSCQCSALQPEGLRVTCNSLNILEVPQLPPDTTELHLQNNQLTTVPPGSFDALQGLRQLNLSGNPFHCGCDIWYLTTWLQDHGSVCGHSPTCATPAALAHKPIAGLSQADFSTCSRKRPTSSSLDIMMILMLCFLIAVQLWCLKAVRSSTFILDVVQRHTGIEADSLRSLKPKHRKRQSILDRTDDSEIEQPLLNMELLPQILDVLQKKHNMKFKAT